MVTSHLKATTAGDVFSSCSIAPQTQPDPQVQCRIGNFRAKIAAAADITEASSKPERRFTKDDLVKHLESHESCHYTAIGSYTSPDRKLVIQSGDQFVTQTLFNGYFSIGLENVGRYYRFPVNELDKIAAIIA